MAGKDDWLHKLPLAPTYYPTDTEFADPIAYISKIEKEASGFGICKVVPPIPRPCKRFVFSNLNKSLLKLPETTTTSSDHPPQPVFTTRHQQLGCTKKTIPPSSPFHKQVWQSGQLYTLDQFQSKAKAFAKTQLSTLKQVTPLAVEDLFWKAASQTPPIYIDYANDVPGSGFGEKGVQPTTAASKLSNSPWNLQVIARSPGSLTRFMLDDIPGVTSPMIYIGMLFSWFAWHVEDHELHSLNFLHVGSPKTWYAIPGDHALPFEQVIRAKAYAGNIDHLASLTLLGEKTNLLSPDVVISSGIPCCRLVQNPGEFVVTFPRAYHIGFSHGFNCGEAANFGTPQWLKVAKAAAVRRAAMDYLPMLSHQQLLYMLTMSFISSIPKALLSGGRTSRLKDRQKEERELRVKKACIDDMLNEKHLLSVLLAKESSLYVVLWDPEALPSPDCGSHVPSSLSPMAAGIHCGGYQHGDRCNGDVHSTRMSMETLQEICKEDDDLPYGLHVDSGTLPCVACGVLGFPFMCIVQPSKDASEELFPGDCLVSQELELRPNKPNAPSGLCDAYLKSASDGHNFVQNRNISPTCKRKTVVTENSLWKVYSEAISTSLETTETRNLKESVSLPCPPNVKTSCSKTHCVDGHPLLSKGQLLHSTNNIPNKWNASNGFLRPRVFCLEHALQIVELLHSKGGANMLILCHSAYPKIKAHAFAVAEEIGVPFDFTEVPLERASKEDIDLITISMDGDGHDEGREDWTARLGLNLRYCVKLRKLSPSQDEQCALPLGVLFADTFFDLDHSNIKWKSRRTRTPYKIAGPRRSKLFSSSQTEKDVNVEKEEKICATRDNKVVQYSRRKGNHRAVLPLQAHSEDHHGPCGKHQRDDTSTSNLVLDSHLLIDTLSSIKNTGNDFLELKRSSVLNSGVQNMNCSIEHTTQVNEIVYSPRPAGSPSREGRKNAVFKLFKSSPIDSSELQHDNCTKVKTKEKGEIADTINGTDSSELRHVNCIKVETKEKGEIADSINGTDVLTVKSRKNCSHELGLLHFVEPHRLSLAVGIREASNVSDNAIFVGSLDIPSSDLESMEAPSMDPNVEKINIERSDHWVTVDTSQTHHKAVFAAAGRELSDIPDPAKLLGSQAKACSYTLIEAGTVKEDKSKACSDVVIGTSVVDTVDMTCHAICEAKVRDFTCSIAQPSFSRNKNYGTSMTLQNAALVESSQLCGVQALEEADRGAETFSVVQGTTPHLSMFNSQSTKRVGRKRKQVDEIAEEKSSCNGFIKSPCEGLRPRTSRLPTHAIGSDVGTRVDIMRKKARKSSPGNLCRGKEVKDDSRIHKCNIERCRMSFKTREQLITHKHNRCTHKGCRKQFSSHKYVLLHQRVHVDDRPLKCPWKGCKMSFKWAWARTEHLRLHTGERPYCCKTEGCELTFRFVSDFSRHRRKSGHRAESS